MQELHWGQLEAEILTELQVSSRPVWLVELVDVPTRPSQTLTEVLQGVISGPRQQEAIYDEISKYKQLHPRLQVGQGVLQPYSSAGSCVLDVCS